jgi:hypothetical protein
VKFKFYQVFSGVPVKFKFYQVFSGVHLPTKNLIELKTLHEPH